MAGHLFIIGVAHGEGHLPVGHHGILEAVAHLIDGQGGMHRLARSVNTTVGQEQRLLHVRLLAIEVVTRVEVHPGRGLVGVGIGEHLLACPLFVGEIALALAVGHEFQRVVLIIRRIFSDPQPRFRQGLSGGGAHGDIADAAVGLFFGHHVDIGHVIEAAHGLRRRIRRELQHIHTRGERRHREGVV